MNRKVNKWSEILGNTDVTSGLMSVVRQVRVKRSKAPKPAILVHGPSRSGKTEAVELTARSMGCRYLDKDTLNPCLTCEVCRMHIHAHGMTDLFSEFFVAGEFEYVPIDCGCVDTKRDFANRLDIIHIHPARPRIYFLDEIQHLAAKDLDRVLWKTVEQVDAIWIAATAYPDELDGMFRNRFNELETEPPRREELIAWLKSLAIEFEYEVEDQQLAIIADHSNRIPGLALKMLHERALVV